MWHRLWAQLDFDNAISTILQTLLVGLITCLTLRFIHGLSTICISNLINVFKRARNFKGITYVMITWIFKCSIFNLFLIICQLNISVRRLEFECLLIALKWCEEFFLIWFMIFFICVMYFLWQLTKKIYYMYIPFILHENLFDLLHTKIQDNLYHSAALKYTNISQNLIEVTMTSSLCKMKSKHWSSFFF